MEEAVIIVVIIVDPYPCCVVVVVVVVFVFVRKYGRVEGVGVSGRGQTAGTADGPLMES
jgi:hypothetical protein